MGENPFKNELLKQNGKSAVDEELLRLREIIAAEERRVRRLLFWTVGVWTTWFLTISLSLGIPFIMKQTATTVATTQPTATAPPSGNAGGGAAAVLKGTIAILVFAVALGLPVAGVILTIMLIVTRRTVSINQVRASLASIDAQLRMLGAPGIRSDETRPS